MRGWLWRPRINIRARRKLGWIIDFQVDPRAPQGVRTVPAFALGG
jgi:hypothetical protein